MTEKLTFSMFGAFSVMTPSGVDMMPRSAKTRALIALLAASDNLSCQRAWAQELLWKDRAPEQRAASLRQALVELRRCWADIPDVLTADRQTIGLNPDRIVIDNSGKDRGQLFLEDLVLKEPAFADWVERHRSGTDAADAKAGAVSAARPVEMRNVVVTCRSERGGDAIAAEHLVHDRLCAILGECAGVSLKSTPGLNEPSDELLITIKASVSGPAPAFLRVVVERLPQGVLLHSASTRLPPDVLAATEMPEVLQLCAQVADVVRLAGPVPNQAASMAGLVGEAVEQMFTFEPARVARAVSLLEQAQKATASGIVAGWLVQALNIQYVERHLPTEATLAERIEENCRQALALAPMNSDVLAAVANARVNVTRDHLAGYELARRAVEMNNANPLAWWALSNALVCIGQARRALEAAHRAQFLAQGTRFAFWADFQASVVSAVLGQTDAATRVGERASALNPAFRPPMRYLVALHAMRGDMDRARTKAIRLTSEERDFSVTRMIEDADYPIGIMRRYGPALTDGLRLLASEI